MVLDYWLQTFPSGATVASCSITMNYMVNNRQDFLNKLGTIQENFIDNSKIDLTSWEVFREVPMEKLEMTFLLTSFNYGGSYALIKIGDLQ